jgi:hypothetical protein
MNVRHPRAVAIAIVGAAVVAAACTASSTKGRPPPGQGRLAVALVDAPTPQVSRIVVNVTGVTAHSVTAGWITVSPPSVSTATPLQVDLLTLQAPATALALGLVDLPPGTITQLRLFVTQAGNYVVPIPGTLQVPLKVPSGTQTGIKIHGPWEITACSQTSVTLDFDGKRSIWYHPADLGSEWILRPVIHTKHASSVPVGCGTACSAEAPCPEGETCVAGLCVGRPPPGPVGADCSLPDDCLSGVCQENGQCGPGGANAPCGQGADCVSGTCDEGSCTATPTATPAGGPCVEDADCITNSCFEGLCEPGVQGSTCGADADCQEGMTCVAASCAAPPP